jgi:Holliday junction DNA helicase RuvA
MIATLRRKVTKFALMSTPAPAAEGTDGTATPSTVVDGNVLEDAYQALLSVGLSPVEARNKLDQVMATGKAFKAVDEVLMEIYKHN